MACCALLALLSLPTVAQAAHVDSSATRDARIVAAIRARLPGAGVAAGSLAALASVTPCPSTPSVSIEGNGSYRTAHLRCAAAAWQLYIPVVLHEARREVVAARDLEPGTPLAPDDVRVVKTDAANAGLVADSLQAVLGHTLAAPVTTGSPISLGALREPIVVHAGQALTVSVESGAMTLKMTATALQDGRVGQSILVRNPHSGKRFTVTVSQHGGATYLLGS